MNDWTPSIIADACAGRWIRSPASQPRGASIDTRTLEPGQIFFALRGHQVDGHAYLAAAADAGASLCVIDRERTRLAEQRVGVLLVADVRQAMSRLASAWRDRLRSTRVVAVTGSAGKTTTVRLIDGALGGAWRGTASKRSFNNDLGVPLTLLNASPSHDYVVCEVGSNAPGEIDALSRIVRPDIGVVTSVGRAHLAGFGSIEGVAREKASITNHLRPGGWGVLNADSVLLLHAITPGTPVRTFGHAGHADLQVVEVHSGACELDLQLHDGTRMRVPMAGRHNASNAACALLVARLLGLDDAPALAGLASVHPVTQRLQVEDLPANPSVRLIDDAYNANPESMLAALESLCELGSKAGRRIAIVGDMLELGEHSPHAHAEVVRRVTELPIDVAVFIGPAFSCAVEVAGADTDRFITIPALTERLLRDLSDRIRPGDAVLVKASRSMRLERVCDEIRGRFAMAGAASADNR